MYRPEYPRPQCVRERWLSLNGPWGFGFDDDAVGERERWCAGGHELAMTIEVPFVFQSALSGIGCPDFHDVVWYRRAFEVPADWRDQRVLLHLGAVDYHAWVYVNGQLVGEHVGGQTGFSLDITEQLTWRRETVVVKVEDPSTDEQIARGKQFWQLRPRGVWYSRCTGIWQSVWLEPVADTHIAALRFTPDVDAGEVGIGYELAGPVAGAELDVAVSFAGEPVAEQTVRLPGRSGCCRLEVFGRQVLNGSFHEQGRCWSPEAPHLFDVVVTVRRGGQTQDVVRSYFGMRKVEAVDGTVLLNNRPYYQKLVLDQGYWPGGLWTAPDDEAFRADIEAAKRRGFNGCRKHQKVEDPRFLYWADTLGFLVWGECAAAPAFGERAVTMAVREWPEIIARDFNHPCILTWVPLNESWGATGIATDARQQSYSLALYHLIHALDPTRLVVSNDGWEHTQSDLCTVHFYRHGGPDEQGRFDTFVRHLSTRAQILTPVPYARSVYARGFVDEGAPIVLSEFGGIGFDIADVDGWGYTRADSADEFVAQYDRLVRAIGASQAVVGFCYTQLYDVEQETNGLLTYAREPKCDPAQIKAINDLIDHTM